VTAKIVVADDIAVSCVKPAAFGIEWLAEAGALEHFSAAAVLDEVFAGFRGEDMDVGVGGIWIVGEAAGEHFAMIHRIHVTGHDELADVTFAGDARAFFAASERGEEAAT